MILVKLFAKHLRKFLKGMFALTIIQAMVFIVAFVIQSCENSDVVYDSIAKNRFLSSLDANRTSIGATSFAPTFGNGKAEVITIYLKLPGPVPTPAANKLDQIGSIDELYDAVHEYGATVQHQPSATNTKYQYDVVVDNVITSLNPVIAEAKQYLYSKGFTEAEIQQMITENHGEESDLVPFVMSLIDVENGKVSAMSSNYSDMLFNSAYAKAVDYKDYIDCALVAIGADVLISLGNSAGTAWTKAAMKKAFGAVAKRALGPVGAAIAAVSFGLCLYDKYK